MKKISSMLLFCAVVVFPGRGQFKSDVIETTGGDLEIFFVGHGTLMFSFQGKVIHIDPTMGEADYSTMPDADLILITHQHGDHLDPKAIDQLLKDGTRVVMTRACKEQVKELDAIVMDNGDVETIQGVGIEAIPAYNIQHVRPDGNPFHPKGEGNGYILSFGTTRVLIGGDTENTPELKELKGPIAVAFLPMNLPYTMTPEMVADAARAIQPGILYPYHFGNTDPQKLEKLLEDEKGIEVRIRALE